QKVSIDDHYNVFAMESVHPEQSKCVHDTYPIEQDGQNKEDGIFLSQDKYVGDILKKFEYLEVRSSNTPMDKENPWGKDGTGKDVDLHLYRFMIRSLMYLTASRPDIMFAVCACARNQVTPKECHLHAFWSTARIETTKKGTKILATVDGILRTVTESSLRKNIKLKDEDGFSSLHDTELFENLTLMGYNISPNQKFTFQKVADGPASPLRDFSQGEACPTDSGFIVDQDRATIAKSSTLPYDLAPRVTSPAAAEGSMQQTIKELTAFYTSMQRQHSELLAKFQAQEVEINRLKERVKLLEDKERVAVEGSGDDAPIKGRNMDESGAAEVPTGSGSIPTVGPPAAEVPTGSDFVPTTSLVFATATVIDAQVARELEEKLEREDQRRSNLGWKVKDFRGMTFEEVESKFNSVWKQLEDFIPMGSKEEVERFKRKGIRFEQESTKKLNPSEEVTKEAKYPNEVHEEKVKDMMQLVPIKEVYVEAL
nr:hypothetical protein [Tanacetum cinerariifolium]